MNVTDESTNSTNHSAAEAATMRRKQMLAIGMLVVLICAGAGFGFWRWQSTRLPNEPLMDPPARGGFGGAGRAPIARIAEPPRDGVRKTGSSYTIRAGQAVMVALPNAYSWRFSYRYQPGKFSSPDQPAFLTAKYQSMSLALTDDQKKQLNALPAFNGGMVASDDDQDRLQSLWKDYFTAADGDKPKREQALVDALKDVGERSVQPTLVAVDAYVAKIQAILTPQQIDKLKKK
jgi:hypothetical protein